MNEWYKNIPPQGVLCKTNGYSNDYAVIVNPSEEDFMDVYDGECISKSGDVYLISELTPLTAAEWWSFAPWQPMKTAPLHEKILVNNVDCLYQTAILNAEEHREWYERWLPLPKAG
jgi:hypothetical protein